MCKLARSSVAVIIALLAGCGPSSDTGDTSATAVTGEVISHAAQIQPIWDARCNEACHLGSAANGGLSLNDGFGATVGVPSLGLGGMNLIAPGNADQSYMWLKLNDTHMGAGGMGAIMPTSGMLASTELDLIHAWIQGGAKP